MALSHMFLEVTSVPLVLLRSKSRPVHAPGRACTGAYPGGRMAGPAGGCPRRCALHWGGGGCRQHRSEADAGQSNKARWKTEDSKGGSGHQ